MNIKKLQIEDINDLANFLVKHTSPNRDHKFWMRRFDLFWNKNPYFKTEENIRGWVIKDEYDSIRGCLLNIPVKYKNNDHSFDGFAASTWYVDEKYRGYSLKLFSSFSLQKGILWDTTPTQRVARIIEKKYKFIRLGKEKIFDVYVPIFIINNLRSFIYKIESQLISKLNLKPKNYRGLMFSELNESQIKEAGEFALRYTQEPIIESHFLSEDITWPYSKKNGFERICIYKNEKLEGIYFLKKSKYKVFEYAECFSSIQTKDVKLSVLKLTTILGDKLDRNILFILFRSIVDNKNFISPIAYIKTIPNPVYCFEPGIEKKFFSTCLRNGDYSFF